MRSKTAIPDGKPMADGVVAILETAQLVRLCNWSEGTFGTFRLRRWASLQLAGGLQMAALSPNFVKQMPSCGRCLPYGSYARKIND
jgi:hypothetical protein